MNQRFVLPLLLMGVGYFVITDNEIKVLGAGIAIFMIGMLMLEDGFRLFAGGTLQHALHVTTNTVPKALLSGFVATSIVQSSSLISVIAISFLSAEMMALSSAVGVVLGSNLGTTATSWIVAGVGLKVKIAYYAMPMLVLGTVMRFSSIKAYKGFGQILIGLGFIFLGIGYLKEGFDAMKDTVDLATIAIPGVLGVLAFVAAGAVMTIIVQSSSAVMAIVITALATGQILYESAAALAIGANIGTTVTAILGSLASNINGKRLAAAHFIFNMLTGIVALLILPWLLEAVELSAAQIGIRTQDYVLKLALFHTYFNLLGIMLVAPFVSQLVTLLMRVFKEPQSRRGEPKYLDATAISLSQPAIEAITKETEHLYDVALEAIMHALLLHRHDVLSKKELRLAVNVDVSEIQIDVEGFYQKRVKNLYGEIIRFATMAMAGMDEEQKQRVYELKLANRDIIEALKSVREMHKNVQTYAAHSNKSVSKEYDFLRLRIAELLRQIESIRNHPDDLEVLKNIEMQRREVKMLDMIENGHIDQLIRSEQIDSKMATSLINDSAYAYTVGVKLLEVASILWIHDAEIRDIGLEEGAEG